MPKLPPALQSDLLKLSERLDAALKSCELIFRQQERRIEAGRGALKFFPGVREDLKSLEIVIKEQERAIEEGRELLAAYRAR